MYLNKAVRYFILIILLGWQTTSGQYLDSFDSSRDEGVTWTETEWGTINPSTCGTDVGSSSERAIFRINPQSLKNVVLKSACVGGHDCWTEYRLYGANDGETVHVYPYTFQSGVKLKFCKVENDFPGFLGVYLFQTEHPFSMGRFQFRLPKLKEAFELAGGMSSETGTIDPKGFLRFAVFLGPADQPYKMFSLNYQTEFFLEPNTMVEFAPDHSIASGVLAQDMVLQLRANSLPKPPDSYSVFRVPRPSPAKGPAPTLAKKTRFRFHPETNILNYGTLAKDFEFHGLSLKAGTEVVFDEQGRPVSARIKSGDKGHYIPVAAKFELDSSSIGKVIEKWEKVLDKISCSEGVCQGELIKDHGLHPFHLIKGCRVWFNQTDDAIKQYFCEQLGSRFYNLPVQSGGGSTSSRKNEFEEKSLMKMGNVELYLGYSYYYHSDTSSGIEPLTFMYIDNEIFGNCEIAPCGNKIVNGKVTKEPSTLPSSPNQETQKTFTEIVGLEAFFCKDDLFTAEESVDSLLPFCAGVQPTIGGIDAPRLKIVKDNGSSYQMQTLSSDYTSEMESKIASHTGLIEVPKKGLHTIVELTGDGGQRLFTPFDAHYAKHWQIKTPTHFEYLDAVRIGPDIVHMKGESGPCSQGETVELRIKTPPGFYKDVKSLKLIRNYNFEEDSCNT